MEQIDCYEPDWEDLAYLDYKQEAFEAFRTEYGCVTRELHDYDKHTDRKLRELSRDSKSVARDLWLEYQFDVASDCFEVRLDGETSVTISRDGLSETSRTPATRKEKRIAKKRFRRLRHFTVTKRGEKSPSSQRLGRQELFARVVAAV